MWNMIPSLAPIVEALAPTFTQPSCLTAAPTPARLGHVSRADTTLRRVAENAHPDRSPITPAATAWTPATTSSSARPGRRGAWPTASASSSSPASSLVGAITLLVDDTLAHKRGKSVWGLGWFRDAVASTKKRVATASGHNWVVLAVAVCVPGTGVPILALPLLARLAPARQGSAQLCRPGRGRCSARC